MNQQSWSLSSWILAFGTLLVMWKTRKARKLGALRLGARRPATPPPALPCESPPRPWGGGAAAAGPGLGHGSAAAGTEPCRLLSPGEGPAPSPHTRRGGPAASFANAGNPSLGGPRAGARAVGAAVGGEAGALPASLHGGSGGSLHCNPVFSHALQHSQQVRSFTSHMAISLSWCCCFPPAGSNILDDTTC